MTKPEEFFFALHKLFLASLLHNFSSIKNIYISLVLETIEIVRDCQSSGVF